MEAGEVPADLTPASIPKEQRIQQLVRLRDRLREKYRELEEREIGENEAEEAQAVDAEGRISATLLKTLRRLADLGVGEYDEEGLKLLRGQRAPVVFEGSGHPVLDKRLSEELTKKQAIAQTDFASCFLTSNRIAKMIRILRDEEIAEKGSSGLPKKKSDAFAELLTKIMTAIKLTVTILRYGHPKAMLEGYLDDDEIIKLEAEKIEERAAPRSLPSVRQQFAAVEQDAEVMQVGEEGGTDEGSSEVDSEDAEDEEEEDDDDEEEEGSDDEIGNEHEKMIREVVIASFLGAEMGKEQEPHKSSKSAQSKKNTEQGTSSANPCAHQTSSHPDSESSETDDCSSLLASSDVICLDGDETISESGNDTKEQTSSSVQIKDQTEHIPDESSSNHSPESFSTPSPGEQNDSSPGPVENNGNKNEQKEGEASVTTSKSNKAEVLLRPWWLKGKTAQELAHNFVHCRPVDDEIQLVFETKDIEYEVNQKTEVPDKYKMKRVRQWLEKQEKPEIVDLDEVVDGRSKEMPVKRPCSGQEMVVLKELPKRPRIEKPTAADADIEFIELD